MLWAVNNILQLKPNKNVWQQLLANNLANNYNYTLSQSTFQVLLSPWNSSSILLIEYK